MEMRIPYMSVVLASGLLLSSAAHGYDQDHKPIFSLGETIGYVLGHSVETMFAQLPLDEIDQNLVSLAMQMTYGQTPEQVVQNVATFCNTAGIPFIKASQTLIQQHKYITVAVNAAQLLSGALPVYSSDQQEVESWLNDLSAMQTAIEYVVLIIKSNPQLVAMILK